jgi:hypothetical protein
LLGKFKNFGKQLFRVAHRVHILRFSPHGLCTEPAGEEAASEPLSCVSIGA